tara:strand:+ start:287 stop:541 length:255 start_codon:yes stop_codon:yes gene_type:complete
VRITKQQWLDSREKEVDTQIAYERKHPFYVMNEYAQVFAGLKGGYPHFSDNIKDARSIYNNAQFNNIQKGHLYKIERIEVEDLL